MRFKFHSGITGAIFYSGANFLCAFSLQFKVDPVEFGGYAFALILVQFGLSLSNASLGSPLVVAISENPHNRAEIYASFFKICLIMIAVLLPIFVLSLWAAGLAQSVIVWGVFYASILWLRWYLRAIFLADFKSHQCAMMDIIYGVICAFGTLVLIWWGKVTVQTALAVMGVAALLSVLQAAKVLWVYLRHGMRAKMSLWRASFVRHGKWALLGVSTAEITANAHAYCLTLFLGPAAYAPVASLALFFRPTPILIQTVTQYERPRLAQLFVAGEHGQWRRFAFKIDSSLAGAAALNGLGVAGLILFAPQWIGGGAYDALFLWPLAALLGVTQITRALRTGASAALQASGEFRALATRTLIAAPLSLGASITALIWYPNPLIGVLIAVLWGEAILCVIILRCAYFTNRKGHR